MSSVIQIEKPELVAAPKGHHNPLRRRALITVLMTISVTVLLFPTIANWFAELAYQEEYGSYADITNSLNDAEVERVLDAARAYNAALPWGPLRDPYLLNEQGQIDDMRDHLPEYESLLNFGDDAPMGWIHVPKISANLPIFHGTSDPVLDKGAGHLHGSALPVGGNSSHSVITAHSGRANSKLFSDLNQLRLGDVFYTEVLGERFYYEVVEIEVVKPDEGEYLRRVEDHDYVTLITCTPTGINTHRLLVKGERIEAPETIESEWSAQAFWPGLPWWLLILAGTAAGTWQALKFSDRRRGIGDSASPEKPSPRHSL